MNDEPGSIWTALLGIDPPATAGGGPAIDEEARGEIADVIALSTICGLDAGDQIEEIVEDVGLTASAAEAVVVRLTRAAAERHADMAAGWEAPTDWDRLDRAFQDLERTGIVARHDLGLSLTDGCDQIDAVVDGIKAAGVAVRGSVFYHRQDAEHAAMGDGLFLVFTGDRNGSHQAKLIGDEVRKALKARGLNGSANARIRVDMVWRRRPS